MEKYGEKPSPKEYVDREEDFELKALYEAEEKRFNAMVEKHYDNIEGEIDLDAHGNLKFRPKDAGKEGEGKDGISDSGTYVLRNGKLVKGSGEARE